MIIKDDRTQEQEQSLPLIVVGTDKFLSGWGEAKGGASYAGWATDGEHIREVRERISKRSDMMRVRVVSGTYRPNPKYCAHFHIYVYR